MKGSLYVSIIILLLLSAWTPGHCLVPPTARWQTPFDTTARGLTEPDSLITLGRVFDLVAQASPTLRGLVSKEEAARGELEQAGLWPNPELQTEFEEIGWDAPGLRESEITVSISQELELFGQRKARKSLARMGIKAAGLAARLEAFDLYLNVKARFFALAHAQEQVALADSSVRLASSTLDDVNIRVQKGAALHSESLLALLELNRGELTLVETQQDLVSAQMKLAALWAGDPEGITVMAGEEPDYDSIAANLPALAAGIDSCRSLLVLRDQADLLKARRQTVVAEARPSLTLTGGYKRLQAEGANSLLLGLALPLPFLDRNQGAIAGLEAELQSLDFEQQRARSETFADISAGITRLNQLVYRHKLLDSMLVPTAIEAHAQLLQAYETGLVPYTSLLNAERSLIELRFEHNDLQLAIRQQIIALESITGVSILLDTK